MSGACSVKFRRFGLPPGAILVVILLGKHARMKPSLRCAKALLALLAAPTSPSSYALAIVLGATVAAKTAAAAALTHGRNGFALEALGACASDLAVYPALALLFAAAEGMRVWLAAMSYSISLVVVVLSLFNAAYIAVANGQLDARTLATGIERFGQVAHIAWMEALRHAGIIGVSLVLMLPLAFMPLRMFWRWLAGPDAELERRRIQGLGACALVGLVLFGLARAGGLPRTLPLELLSDNVLVHTYATWVEEVSEPVETYQGALERHFALPMVDRNAPRAIAAAPDAPNVLFFVLESTRFDAVELPIPGHRSMARTPNLRQLAQRGLVFTDAHTTIPHTSKALFSMMCGRLPAMETQINEIADQVAHDCLPQVFRQAGYATAFMQSAIGSFEWRPRLTVRLGYDHFAAFETIHAAPAGYLGGDDRALAREFGRWLGTIHPNQRFFATILTSGTHHPYYPPAGVQVAHREDDHFRYARAVELEDGMIGSVVALLRETGRLEHTIIVALADHGEGLSGDPVHQHDNDFFESGLHVPLIMAGPGVPHATHEQLVSMADIAPTVLGRFGIQDQLPDDELRFGFDVLRAPSRRHIAPFACWNDGVCEGYVTAATKVVRLPAERHQLAFDRGQSPPESRHRRLTRDEAAVLARAHQAYLLTHLRFAPLSAEQIQLPSGFICGPGREECYHPSRPQGGFHAPPKDFVRSHWAP